MPVRSKCIASQELRAETLGFFRPRLAPFGLRKPALRSSDRFGQHAVGLGLPSSGVVLLHT